MKFLEVKLFYMNTNLVQENFSRYGAAPDPHRPLLPSVSGLVACWESFW